MPDILQPQMLLTCSDGLLGSYEVGIWLVSTRELLASTIVTPASPLGVLPPPNVFGFFRYAPIPTVAIPAGGQFVIAALLPETRSMHG